MAAANPSYYWSSGCCQDIGLKEHRFHLYMNQQGEELPNSNQKSVVGPGLPNGFGNIVVLDWTIRDVPATNANIVARARGTVSADGKADENWLLTYSIVFTDTRFKGSSLKVNGDYQSGKGGQWAIVGGTGEFAYAQGVVNAKVIQPYVSPTGLIWELEIRAFCLCISELSKMGPWGGVGGSLSDVPQPPQSLQTVTIGYGDVINSLAFSYTDDAGQKKTAGPWGGNGALTTTITLAPSEIIQQVSGTTGTIGGDTVVTSLTLVSNLTTYGPFGKPNGTQFSSHVPNGKAVTGFYARAGASLINAIGIYYA